jgi:hypothetical protein
MSDEKIPAGYFIAEMLKEFPLNKVVEITAKMSDCDEATALEIVYHVQTKGPVA